MKAVAVFPQGREVKVIDVPEPKLRSPTQVRVRTLEVGVCGTDKEVVEQKHGKPATRFNWRSAAVSTSLSGAHIRMGTRSPVMS